MNCPKCKCPLSFVTQTTKPLGEGFDHGDIKRRLRKCKRCERSFTTFEIHESEFRIKINKKDKNLSRSPLLVEENKGSVLKEVISGSAKKQARLQK